MIEQSIRDLLRVSVTVRNRVDGHVFAGNIPHGVQGECVLLQDITSENFAGLAGEIGKAAAIVQVTCYAERSHEAFSLAEVVRNRISGYRGSAGAIDPVIIDSCLPIGGGGSGQETAVDSSDRWLHSYTRDYEVFFETSVPTLT